MFRTIQTFDRIQHLYTNDAFVELVRDAIRFFHGTPVHTLPFVETFLGTGVYALYYTGTSGIYSKYGELNRLGYNNPIYVGKAVPKGWQQS
jgi:Eco29kI restriction endonuclease